VIPYQRIAAFLQEVEALAKEKRENDASRRVENAAARMEAMVEKIEKENQKKTSPVTYAQAVRAGQAQGMHQGTAEPALNKP
jgi:flagellar biosynthesis/type III secretory pathway protein FliH